MDYVCSVGILYTYKTRQLTSKILWPIRLKTFLALWVALWIAWILVYTSFNASKYPHLGYLPCPVMSCYRKSFYVLHLVLDFLPELFQGT